MHSSHGCPSARKGLIALGFARLMSDIEIQRNYEVLVSIATSFNAQGYASDEQPFSTETSMSEVFAVTE